MAHSWYRRLSAGDWLFLALAGYSANLLGTGIHEFLGHGLVALSLGGQFQDVFVSPLSGQAGATAPGALNAVVLASGSLVEILFGAAAWSWLRRRISDERRTLPCPDYMACFLWLFAVQAILDSIIYVTFVPTFQSAFETATGDWPLLLQSRPFARTGLVIAGIFCVLPVTGALIRDSALLYRQFFRRTAGRLAETHGDAPRFRRIIDALVPYTVLLLPMLLLHTLYAAAVSPWLSVPLPLVFGSIFDLLLLGLPGAMWIAWRNGSRVRPSSKERQVADRHPSTWRWNGGLLCVAGTVLAMFGPTDALREGLLLSAPNGDQYIGAAQRIRLRVDLANADGPVVSVLSRPLHDSGGRYRRRLTGELAGRGPSAKGARQMSEFIARWNLGGAGVGDVSEPRPVGGEWTWQFELVRFDIPLKIAIWPVTWVQESCIREIRIIGGTLAVSPVPNVRTEDSGSPALVWTRPVGMEGVQRFRVEW